MTDPAGLDITDPAGLGPATIGARLDRLRWSRRHLGILLALGAGWLFDSLEVNLVGSFINPLDDHFGASATAGQFVFFAWLLGILVGALVGGRLADRFGRRRMFVATLLWYAGFTVLTGASVSLSMVVVLRFVTGLGVGAEYAVINAAVAEFMPARIRGRAGAAVMNFWAIGAIAAGLLAFLLLNAFALAEAVSWRYGFALGGVLAGFVLFFRRRLPESPRWLVSQGRHGEAEAIVRGLESAAGLMTDAPLAAHPVEAAQPGLRAALGELVRRYPSRLALGCALDLSEAFGYYGIFAFVSLDVLHGVGFGNKAIPFVFVLGNVGALAGGVLMTTVFDRLGHRLTVGACYGLAAATVGLLAWATDTGLSWFFLLAFLVANAAGNAAWTSAYPTFTELFPTHLRGAGVGFSVAVGRIGAACGVLLVTTVGATAGLTAGYLVVVAFWLVGVVAIVVYTVRGGTEPARTPLELLTARPRVA